jgi:Uma2 family endonuclease
MNALPKLKPMTVEAFLAWAETRPDDERYELWDGAPVMQAKQRLAHIDAKMAAAAALRNAIRKAGLPCFSVGDGATVKINDYTALIPDALVYCGPRLPGDAVIVPNPVIVVEVLSPSSIQRDMADKVRAYFRVPSVMHYLIIDADEKRVVHHARLGEGLAPPAIYTEGEARLDPPGLALPIAELFDG